MQTDDEPNCEREIIQTGNALFHPINTRPNSWKGRKPTNTRSGNGLTRTKRQDLHQVHDAVQKRSVNRRCLNSRVRKQHDEGNSQASSHDAGQRFVGAVIRREICLASGLCQSPSLGCKNLRCICLLEEEKGSNLHKHIEYRR